MRRRMLWLFTVILIARVAADERRESVVRATLENGLRVVVVRDPLAPVVTVEENYIAGGNETPFGFPGMAHAQEHMAFRGCAGVSGDQIAAIYAQLGGSSNAIYEARSSLLPACLPNSQRNREPRVAVDGVVAAGVEQRRIRLARPVSIF